MIKCFYSQSIWPVFAPLSIENYKAYVVYLIFNSWSIYFYGRCVIGYMLLAILISWSSSLLLLDSLYFLEKHFLQKSSTRYFIFWIWSLLNSSFWILTFSFDFQWVSFRSPLYSLKIHCFRSCKKLDKSLLLLIS